MKQAHRFTLCTIEPCATTHYAKAGIRGLCSKDMATATVETGHKASPTAGSVEFRRCPACGLGQHFNMLKRTPMLQCHECGNQWVR